MPTAAMQTRRWTRQEYDRMATVGLFHPHERLELLDGEIFTSHTRFHAAVIGKIERALQEMFGAGYNVRVRKPLALDPDSKPQPDLAVVDGSPSDYLDREPSTAVLVVEVADSLPTAHQELKRRVYARAGIPEYWLINIDAAALEMYREPLAPANGQAHYQVCKVSSPSETAYHLSQPVSAILVRDLLP